MSDYCILGVVLEFFLIGCRLYLRDNDIFDDEVLRKFKRLIIVVMIEIGVDDLFALLEGKESLGALLYILKGGELLINPIVAFLVLEIFVNERLSRKRQLMRKLRGAMLLTVAACGVLLVVEAFTEKVFYIDEANMYHRGDLMGVYVTILLVATALMAYGVWIFSDSTQGTLRRTLMTFTLTLIAGIVLRGVFPRNNYDFLCVTMSILFLLIYYSHVMLRIDPLTQLLNRLVYEALVKRVNWTTAVIMVDANYLKKINDSCGHKRGDKVLKQLAYLMRENYGKQAYCFRIGGDEFCAIMKKGALDKMTEESPDEDMYAAVEKFKERFETAIAERIQAAPKMKQYLKYGVAQGSEIYYAETYVGDDVKRMSMNEVIREADRKMYERKEQMKKEMELADAEAKKAEAGDATAAEAKDVLKKT